MLFRQIVDNKLAQYAYLVGCQQTGEALIIDPERDVDRYLELVEEEGLTITAVAETHIHADFLSGARELAERLPEVKLYLSDEGDADWKYQWTRDGDYDVTLLKDGDIFKVGNIEIEAVHTPGHTPEHLSFLVTDRGGGAAEPMGIVTGDFVFVGDLGRPDLLESAARVQGMMEPSARRLYHSVRDFLKLEDHVQVWPGHGAGSACGKAPGAVPQTTVGYERQYNAALGAAEEGEDAFVDAILEGQSEPPLYFARMKQLNKEGVPVLGELPRPERLSAGRLGALAGSREAVVIDARHDRRAFMARHLPGSIYVAFNRAFNTAVGSVVADAEQPIYLILDEERNLEEAVRDLIRIGFDNIAGYATADDLDAYAEQGGQTASIDVIDIEALEEHRQAEDAHVLDVRYSSEYASGHVPGAQNISYTRLAERLGEVPADKKVLVHCGSGARASVATSLLAREGRQVTLVEGRYQAYRERHGDEKEAVMA